MKELTTYLEAGEIDNAELLRIFAPYCRNLGILGGMLRNKKIRDTHVKYQVWKALDSEQQQQFKSLLIPAPSKPQTAKPENNKEEARAITAKPIPQKEISTEDAMSERASLGRQAAKLANTLYDCNTDAERKEVRDKIMALEAQMKTCTQIAAGKTPERKKQPLDFAKSKSEIDALTEMEKKGYKSLLSQKKTRAKQSLEQTPTHKNAAKWQAIIEAVDELYTLL